jgi:hypothetical protein
MEEALRVVSYFFVFPFVLIAMFLWHEMMHSFDGWLQGVDSSIHIRFWPPGAYTSFLIFDHQTFNDIRNAYAGGLYTAPVCFLMLVFTSDAWFFSFATMGFMQGLYGLLEGTYMYTWSPTKFKIARYTLYIGVTIISIVIWTLLH